MNIIIHMYEIIIDIPFLNKEVLYFRSLSEASRTLQLTEYFLRNAYSTKHQNQFSQFFTITKCKPRKYHQLRKHYPLQ